MTTIISKIDPTNHSVCGVFLLNAMSRQVLRADLLNHFKIEREDGKPVIVDVTMQINGVSVDFERSVTEMWERMFKTYEDDVLEKANSLVTRSKFAKLMDIMAEAERSIEHELLKLHLIDEQSE